MSNEDSLNLLNSKTGNVKSTIIEKLSRQWPLTVKQLDNALKREYGINVTYQAVHKAVHELEGEQIVESISSKYQLSKNWITRVNATAKRINEVYTNNESIDFDKDLILLKFSNWVTMGRYMGLNFKIEFPNPDRKPTICNWIHVWPTVTLSTEEIQKLGAIHAQCKNYSVCPNSSPMDKLFSEWLNSVGNTSKTGQDITLGFDYIVRGDHVAQIYYTKDFANKVHKLYQETINPQKLDLKELQKIATLRTDILIVIIKSRDLADYLRRETLNYFNSEIKRQIG